VCARDWPQWRRERYSNFSRSRLPLADAFHYLRRGGGFMGPGNVKLINLYNCTSTAPATHAGGSRISRTAASPEAKGFLVPTWRDGRLLPHSWTFITSRVYDNAHRRVPRMYAYVYGCLVLCIYIYIIYVLPTDGWWCYLSRINHKLGMSEFQNFTYRSSSTACSNMLYNSI